MTERAWIDAGAAYLRRDEQCDAAPTADDLAELDGDVPADDTPEPPVGHWAQAGDLDREALPF
jgi:hypothetical protein